MVKTAPNYCRLRSSFFTFLASFFSFGVLAGSFFTDFFVSLLLLIVVAPFWLALMEVALELRVASLL